jgi:O-antigen ligase
MDDGYRLEAPAVEQADEPPSHDGVCDADDIRASRGGVLGPQDFEAADFAAGQAVVEETGDFDAGRQRRVERLPPDAPGAGDVESHVPHPADRGGPASRGWLIDGIGVALVLAAIGWTYVAASGHPDARPGSRAMLLAGVAGAYVAGRVSSRWFPVAGPGMLAAAVVAGMVASPGAFSGESGAPPLGYANANAAFLVQTVAGVVIAALSARAVWGRRLLLVAAVGLAALVPLLRSVAGSVLALAVVLVGVTGARLRRPAIVIAGGACCAALAVTATVVLGATARDARPQDRVDRLDRVEQVERVADEQLTAERVTLWNEAIALTRANPLTGVGPGRFAEESPTARGDRDLRWAHTAVLEQAAEQGIPGGLLLLGLAGWAFAALTGSRRSGPVIAAGAAAFTALAVHASVDYVLHFAAVPLVGGALLGLASARQRGRSGRA